ncbi:hypothetical protein GCM10023147_21780 [Tsukamurella soli]|uniref:Uncharacterized protein n=1 Tax=Tsukamurella soli TaxID=644556 RepID=A0ABP8JKA2_9ACTN
MLDGYRAGDVDGFVGYVATAALHSCAVAAESLLAAPSTAPVFDADTAQGITGTAEPSTYRALNRLVDAGVLEVITESKRNRIWAAVDVLAEFDALSSAVGRRVRHDAGGIGPA